MKANTYPGNCSLCSANVPAGEGKAVRKASGSWEVEHHDCPKAGAIANGAGIALWAVERVGRTVGGNQARGFGLVSGARPHGEAWPVDEAAAASEHETPWLDPEHQSRRLAEGNAWLAFWQLDGLEARTLTPDQLDTMLGERDVAKMRAAVAHASAAIRARFEEER